MSVCVVAHTPELAKTTAESIVTKVPAPKKPPDSVSLEVWAKDGDDIDSHRHTITTQSWADIERNYADDTRSALQDLISLKPGDLSDHSGRLILFHGPPGTGKTHAIRALLNAWAPWCEPQLVVDPEIALHDYGYLRRLLAPERPGLPDRWRLVVAEDADRFIRSDNRGAGNAVLDRLLNATDGILGQGSRTSFLLTTNIELATVNPALARPGRSLAVIAFQLFNYAEARRWLGEDSHSQKGEISLAELYELKRGAHRPTTQRNRVHGQYL